MTHLVELNHHWKYIPQFLPEYTKERCNEDGFCDINIPHTNLEVPYNGFDEKSYQFISTYRKTFKVPFEFSTKRIFVDFAGVMIYAEVYINGQKVGSNKGGYTPFSFELSDHIIYDSENVLTVIVDSTERSDIPPFGNEVDYLCYGGIYREVNLRFADKNFIERTHIRTPNVMADQKSVNARIYLEKPASGDAAIVLSKDGKTIEEKNVPFTDTREISVDITGLNDIAMWDINSPNLYDIKVNVSSDFCDESSVRFGFREAALTKNGFFLNGKHVKLMGLDRHQSYPYVGYAMPARAQRKDADILKNELNLNCVRTSHYPQSVHFLDRCDEIGLLVFEEIPGWQFIGDEAWQSISCRDVQAMIERDFNHPSIFLWGVRINESQDNHDFFTKTNAIAHELDETRQTGGVRCICNSELLEDVYTFNDFIHTGDNIGLRKQQEVTGLDHDVPYLVTEYNGHMFPTKRYDGEERVVEHTLRHMRVQNASFADDAISGAIGWCAFDYNTHYSFGSGDRICHHGVSDMFRIPKFAAYAYTSQCDPSLKVVLEPITLWTRGDKSKGGALPVIVATNCDKVDLIVGGKRFGTYYPDKEAFPALPHPPVTVGVSGDEWGCSFFEIEFIGYLSDREVVRRKMTNVPVPTALAAIADDAELSADGIDVTRVVYKLVDQEGNLMPYINEYIEFEIDGPGSIIGPSKTALIGGCIGVWVKSSETAGKITLKAKCSRFAAKDIVITTK